jgi:hypothetical protein
MNVKTMVRMLEAADALIIISAIVLCVVNLNPYWLLLMWLKKPILKISANLLYLWPDAKELPTRTR